MMNTASPEAASQYEQIGTRSEIESASPHRLIQLMMERVLTKIAVARGHMEQNAVVDKGRHIGDAISIVGGLQASLNHETEGGLASNFDALYDYMTRRLLEANLRNDPAMLDEVTGLMRELKEAWDEIGPEVSK